MDLGELLAVAVGDEQPRRVRADVDAGAAHDAATVPVSWWRSRIR
jgi:hypothetical protein